MEAFFNEDFWNVDGVQLRRPSLSCLKLDSMTYSTLLLQLKEEIAFDNTGIWLLNEERAQTKFNSFFDLAIEKEVELAITPEYSCPWNVLGNLISEGKFPSVSNLWVLGMASIQPSALKEFIDGNDRITWIYDEDLLKCSIKAKPNKFFDPVCFLLNTNDNVGKNHQTIIIQFKNNPFGGTDAHWERDNVILGKTFYVIKNQFASTKLVTLICSDTLEPLNFNEIQDGMFLTSPLLILHIQLNQKPTADSYKLYRNLIFQKGGKDWDKEIVCLNWARNVSYYYDGDSFIFNHVAGSAFYLKSTKLSSSDESINRNHNGGMYYTNWSSKRTHVYLLNFDEHVYLVENTKASQVGADPTQFNRTGPTLRLTYEWNEGVWQINENRIDDGFKEVVSEIEHEPGTLNCLINNENYLEVERMVQLCSGEIDYQKKDWFSISNLSSLIIDDNEIDNRVIFTQQIVIGRKVERMRKLNNYSILKHNIISKAGNLPYGMDNAKLTYLNDSKDLDKYLLNIHSGDDEMHATAIYVGSLPMSQAKMIQKKISDLFSVSQYGKTVMVWYETIDGKKRIPDSFDPPVISESVERKSNDFTKKQKI